MRHKRGLVYLASFLALPAISSAFLALFSRTFLTSSMVSLNSFSPSSLCLSATSRSCFSLGRIWSPSGIMLKYWSRPKDPPIWEPLDLALSTASVT
ncbi:hypothetical protein CTA1_11382 [Colletotrichum tanaceti]|uniref:Uncharacterized protein n=1 Tax=Colletotrichum tanaceti TaxID=1306861 RepID=A0A4U6XJ44_9PEZI|nr:hypothetical protein CTA1_11382 [Colletotrichum tanaceti]